MIGPAERAARVLVVDDEPGVLRLLKMEFDGVGFAPTLASNPAEALAIADRGPWPDIAVLDLVMPTMSGIGLMKKLRERRPLPAIILTARSSEPEKIRGLEAGADDYVTKPFSPDELTARVRAVLRRRPPSPERDEHRFKYADIEVNFGRRVVVKRGGIVRLSRTEWKLMEYLASHHGKVVPNASLVQTLWGPDGPDDPQCVRVWISRLRHKIEDHPNRPKLVRTVPGGYVFGRPTPKQCEDEHADAADLSFSSRTSW